MKTKKCGGCKKFKNEDINGFGMCEIKGLGKHCGDECNVVAPTVLNKKMTAEEFKKFLGSKKKDKKETYEIDRLIKRSNELLSKIMGTDVKRKKVENTPIGLIEATKKRSKFRNVKTHYNEITFDSKKECEFYKTLEFQKKVGIIKDFIHQHTMRLEVNGFLICKIVLDFKVINNNNTVDYVDIKAFSKATGKFISTPDWKIKKKLCEAIYSIKINIK